MKQKLKRALWMLICLMAMVNTNAQTIVTVDGLQYSLSGAYAAVYGVATDNKSEVISIPSSIIHDGVSYSVNQIMQTAFATTREMYNGHNNIYPHGSKFTKKIIVPSSILRIGRSAFDNRTIEEVYLSEGVTYIGAAAFRRTKIKTIVIPKSVKEFESGSSDYDYSENQKYGTFVDCNLLRTIIYLSDTPPSNWTATSDTYVPSMKTYSNPYYSINNANIIEMISFSGDTFTYTGTPPNVTWTNNVEGYTAELTMPEINTDVHTYVEKIPATFTKGKENFEVEIPYRYTILPVLLTAKVKDASRQYGEDNPSFSISYTGFVNDDDESVIIISPIATTTATANSEIGTYPITISRGGAKNYKFEYEEGTLTVNKASLTINIEEATKVYGTENPSFSLNYSGLKNGETTPAWETAPTFTTDATKTSDVGTYNVNVACVPKNYTATITQGKLKVTQAPLTIGVKNATRPYCGTEPTYTYTYSGFVNGDNENVLTKKPTIKTEAKSTSNVGNYTITPTGAQAKNYAITYTDGTLDITQVPLTVRAESYTRNYGKENPTFSLAYEGFVNKETKAVLLSQPTASTSATINSNAGTYDIRVSGGRAFNYALKYESGQLTIKPVPLKISVGNYERPYNQANPKFELKYEGLVASDTESSLQNKPVVRTLATKTSVPGTYALEVTGAYSPNYTITYGSGVLTIVKAEQTLEWEQDLHLLKVDEQIELKARAESGLPITYTMSAASGAELYPAGNKTYLECKSPCEFTITAVQNGNGNYYSTQRITKKVKIVTEEDYEDELKDIHHITYVVDGQPYKVVSYTTGEAIIPEKAPTKEGYTFSGWSLIPATMPAKNLTVTGTFAINSYTLTYLVDGKTYKTYKLDFGAHITPEAQPKKDGYTFSGWDMVPANMPAYDVTVNGSFTLIDAIEDVIADDGTYQIFTLDGRLVESLQKGVNIIRYSNGTTKSVYVK